MKDFKILLKYLERYGYPNKNLQSLFNSLDYDSENFLPDLVSYLGQDGAKQFVGKTIEKLNTPEGIRIDLEDEGYPNSHVFLKIDHYYVDLDEAEDSILIEAKWIGGEITHPETGETTTVKQLYHETDMQEWSDILDMFEGSASRFFASNCGYYLWYT